MPPVLRIARADAAERSAAFAYHYANAGEFLVRRTETDFELLVDRRGLFLLWDDTNLAGLCFVSAEGDRWEFSGVFVDPVLRGRGAATALGRAAISTIDFDSQPSELIAHVHQMNDEEPRSLLKRLGFVKTDQADTLPPRLAPLSMRRNAEGHVVGDIFRFDRRALADFAAFFETFEGSLAGKGGMRTLLTFDVDEMSNLGALASELRRCADN